MNAEADKVLLQEEPINIIRSIDGITDAQLLHDLLDTYNWDDGLDIPVAIANNSNCELATAIRLFWLSGGGHFYESDERVEVEPDLVEFWSMLSERVLSNHYFVSKVSHFEEFNKVAIYKFDKANVPKILYTPVVANNTECGDG